MTVSSMTSVSDQPASILVCIHQSTATHKILQMGDNFSCNILAADQQDVSHHCAFSKDDEGRFTFGDWRQVAEGVTPYLHDGLASFLCKVSQRIDYGTHTIIIGDITRVYTNDQAREPLIYRDGQYTSVK